MSPERPTYLTGHPLGCHRPRVLIDIVFAKLIQVLGFGCSYEKSPMLPARPPLCLRCGEWIRLGIFPELERIMLEHYDRIVGSQLDDLAVDGCIAKPPVADKSSDVAPVDGATGHETLDAIDANGVPWGVVLAPTLDHQTNWARCPNGWGAPGVRL